MPERIAYGSWPSPISADMAAASGRRIGDLQCDGDDILWVEGRSVEKGRCVIVRARNTELDDLIDAPFSARTMVHEYGGGALRASRGDIYFSNVVDGRLHRLREGAPEAITPDIGDVRYADMDVDARRERLVCVVEDHRGARVMNDIRIVPCAGGEPLSLVSGNDFYASPRVSPDGESIAWLTWNQPNMPWDGCELWTARLDDAGALVHARLVAGGPRESIFQPAWSPESVLHFSSDRTGWWNLHRIDDGAVVPVAPMQAECGRPQWAFALSTYAFCDDGRILMWACADGVWGLSVLDAHGSVEPIDIPFNAFGGHVDATGDSAVFLAGSPRHALSVVQLDLRTGEQVVLRSSSDINLPGQLLSEPRHMTFSGYGGATSHAWYYAPRNDAVEAVAGSLPPLVVRAHGGPTSATSPALDPALQYWTSRGFALVDVDYGGSTGYGRPYRERLDRMSGIVDVGDCVAAARHLAERGDVDAARLFVQGGSAGGYIVLCAMTFHDVFAAGASLFGIADLELLFADSHKFEARYESPFPVTREGWYERSPIHFIDRVRRAVLLLQGLDDRVVPPNQAETMFAELRTAGVPCAYIAFAGEGHGFRQASNIRRSLEAQLYFFATVTGTELADDIEPVPITNLDDPV